MFEELNLAGQDSSKIMISVSVLFLFRHFFGFACVQIKPFSLDEGIQRWLIFFMVSRCLDFKTMVINFIVRESKIFR